MWKMSEKEGIEALKQINLSRVHPFYSWEEMLEVRNMAIATLEEVQTMKKVLPDLTDEDIKTTAVCLEELLQYRAIGTVSEVKYLIDSYNDMIHDFGDDMDLLEQYKAIGTVEEVQKSVKEEDVLKFYYIESEDKYVVGKRLDNFYYAEVGRTGLSYRMSRYLPWGKHVVAPETAWKEYTYCSEPKEIPFFEWLQGFIRKECGGAIDECREAVERMKPKKVIIKPWCAAKCPTCGKCLSTNEGDGYYSHWTHIERCPNAECSQRLLWEE